MVQHADLSHANIGAAVVAQDDGSTVGTASVINFTNGTVTYSGGTATVNLASGGGITGVIYQSGGNTVGTATVVNHTNGTVTFSSGTATVTPLPSKATSDASGDTATLTADTETDMPGCSISLAAGNWLIGGVATSSSGTSTYILGVITDSSNNHVSMGRGVRATGTPVSLPIPVRLVSPGSTTTYKLRVQCGLSSGTFLRYGTGTTPSTAIWAIRVA